MKNVLILGGLGFIGGYLSRKCVELGYNVTILSRSDSKIENIKEIRDSVKLIIKDVKDIGEEVKDQDIIFHLAGSTDNYAIIDGEPYKDIDMNCNSTIALLEACKNYSPKAKIVFASTFFVNGRPKDLPVGPNSPTKPLGLYGATRLAAEHFCQIYSNIFDLDIVIARFTNVFGPKEIISKKKAGFNYLINLAVNGNELKVYGGGEFYRDYIYVEDVIDACLTLADKGISGKVYYVGRGEFVKFKELVDIIVKETGVLIVNINPPDFHLRVGIKDFVSDVSDLKSLGWYPKVSLDEGIKKTIAFYRNLKNIG
ncbi:NAD-dependent epimerase/dehydratase family protein [archaeon]|jgi:UDP-glucose 4-epimerase|nr:NAD-dependent epimerase/dehydratase family protein [archaeon]MBT4396843.1 NAD-dependent epimerase/dehydratase family protein [archaeon]MBT4441479.1 NAD-dependent epimerase/dehydratase family protein [archaeon]